MPTRSDAVRCLAGGPSFDFAEGYPSAFVVQLFRLSAQCPVELSTSDAPLGPWLAVRSADRLVVGAVSCAPVWQGPDVPTGVVERSVAVPEASMPFSSGSAVTVGYDVARSCEGRGYATEMMRLVCAHLLAQPGIVRVCADTEAGHRASRRVMEKAGLTWRREESELRDGRATAVAHYALDRGPAAVT